MNAHHSIPGVALCLLALLAACSGSHEAARDDTFDLSTLPMPESPRAMAILGGDPSFSGSTGSVMLEISDDSSSIEGRLITSRFGTPVEQVGIRLGRSSTGGPLVLVVPVTPVPGEEVLFRVDESDFCPPELCDLEDLRSSGIESFAQVIGSIQGSNASFEVTTEKHPDGEIRGQLTGALPRDANVACFHWGCACEGYNDCNRLIAACEGAGASWRCIQYNEWGGCEVGACVTLGPVGGGLTNP